MATVAVLNVAIKSTSEKFTRGLKAAGAGVKSFASGIMKAGVGIAAFSSAVTAGAALALGHMVNQTRQAIDAIGKLATNTGVAVEDLQALQLGAELSGVAFSSVERSMKGFIKRLGEAQRGVGEAASISETLGLNAEELARMDPSAAFREVLDVISQLPNQAQQADAATKLFGRTGQEMLVLIQQGAAGLEGWRTEIDEMGAALNRMDIAQVEAMNDSWARSAFFIKGIKERITAELAPAIGVILEKLRIWLLNTGGVGRVSQKVINFLSEGFAAVAGVINKVIGVVKWLQAGFTEFIALVARGVAKIVGFFDKELARGLMTFVEELDAQADRLFREAGQRFERVKPPKFIIDFRADVDNFKADVERQFKESPLNLGDVPTKAGVNTPRAIAAVEQGSIQAAQAIANILMGDQAQRVQEKQLAEQKRQTKILEDIRTGNLNFDLGKAPI